MINDKLRLHKPIERRYLNTVAAYLSQTAYRLHRYKIINIKGTKCTRAEVPDRSLVLRAKFFDIKFRICNRDVSCVMKQLLRYSIMPGYKTRMLIISTRNNHYSRVR